MTEEALSINYINPINYGVLDTKLSEDAKQKVEKSLNTEVIQKLQSIGHTISIEKNAIGGGQCIKIDRKNGILVGGSDPRKDGMAIGY